MGTYRSGLLLRLLAFIYTYSVCLLSIFMMCSVVKCVVFVICVFHGILLRKCFWLLFIGKPDPVVSWYVNGELEDSTYHVNRFGEVINELAFRGLNRSHLGSHFSCRASNTRLIQPVEKSVVLDLNCKLRTLKISYSNSQSSFSRTEPLHCFADNKETGGRRNLKCFFFFLTLPNMLVMYKHSEHMAQF